MYNNCLKKGKCDSVKTYFYIYLFLYIVIEKLVK